MISEQDLMPNTSHPGAESLPLAGRILLRCAADGMTADGAASLLPESIAADPSPALAAYDLMLGRF